MHLLLRRNVKKISTVFGTESWKSMFYALSILIIICLWFVGNCFNMTTNILPVTYNKVYIHIWKLGVGFVCYIMPKPSLSKESSRTIWCLAWEIRQFRVFLTVFDQNWTLKNDWRSNYDVAVHYVSHFTVNIWL